MSTNRNLHNAKKAQRDEFYSRYEDIENELKYYWSSLEGKTVYCNCDDGNKSNFYRYFKNNFNSLGLRKLISTNYDIGEGAWSYVYDGKNTEVWPLNGNGDFRSEECLEFLRESDIVVTNPPFSLFMEFIDQMMQFEKKFLVIGNINALAYKSIFQHILENRIWTGVSVFNGRGMYFNVPEDYTYGSTYNNRREIDGVKVMRIPNICWFTNIEHNAHRQPIELTRRYNPDEYRKYDRYDVIEVSKVADIPIGYDGVMAVPITFIGKYCPEQFEILGNAENPEFYERIFGFYNGRITLDGKEPYKRVFIRHR